ncbi:hypothetical protein PAPYR_8068 [Paratrimastix pyriformis]|uniref:Uncharacterized protein n=1 Tax=Paratrimastix pyriformis TaxID=342808 RepID=A0ABQ8UE65_9EUKA|nr:hypothetical protein PAPYR_8068 [Paratrimastix pyriformis]
MIQIPSSLGLFASLLDLLPCIRESSDHPIQTYLQLLGLSHGIRSAVRRNPPHDLCFDGDPDFRCEAPMPTADALAAIVGPCKNLTKLSFRSVGQPFHPNVYGCGRTEAAFAEWVDEAFDGHDRLEVLEYLPTTFEPIIERILPHLRGLLELRLGNGTPISTDLLSIIARSCPHLQVLRSDCEKFPARVDFTVLASMARSLRQFRFHHAPLAHDAFVSLDALVSNLSTVGTLHLCCCPIAVLEPLASHLTCLSLDRVGDEDDRERDMPGPDFSRLERLSLRRCSFFSVRLAQLLDANRATLQRLRLEIITPNRLDPLMAALGALPRLTHLKLTFLSPPTGYPASPALPLAPRGDPPGYFSLASPQLRCLHIENPSPICPVTALSLDCPVLSELQLPATRFVQLDVHSPRLCVIRNLPVWFKGFPTPIMPDLETLSAPGREQHDPVWLPDLLAGAPRLRSLDVALTRPDLLPLLCTCDSLVELGLELALMPSPLVLGMPGRLKLLRLTLLNVKGCAGVFDLQLEAPRLRLFDLHRAEYDVRIRLECPALTTLRLAVSRQHRLTCLELDEPAQLRSLTIEEGGYLEPATILGLLALHRGARLRHVGLLNPVAWVWPHLVTALGELPRLTSLRLNVVNAPPQLSLTCPQLRALDLFRLAGQTVLELKCPLLETLSGCQEPGRQVVLPSGCPRSTRCAVYPWLPCDLDDPAAII